VAGRRACCEVPPRGTARCHQAHCALRSEHTDARKVTVRRFGRSDRRMHRQRDLPQVVGTLGIPSRPASRLNGWEEDGHEHGNDTDDAESFDERQLVACRTSHSRLKVRVSEADVRSYPPHDATDSVGSFGYDLPARAGR
jgi:hypothetical protein